MDDSDDQTRTALRPRFRICRRLSSLLLIPLVGCSLMVMTGKMLTGNPLTVCAFTQSTGVDLEQEQKKVLVYCTFPEAAREEYSSVSANIVEALAIRLKREGVKIVKPGKVSTWIGARGGIVDDRDELAAEFEPDYIIHIELDEFTHRADNSPNMYQGRTLGDVSAYKVVENSVGIHAAQVFSTEFKSVYPTNNPISKSKRSERTFLRNYEARISAQIGQLFHNHRIDATYFLGG